MNTDCKHETWKLPICTSSIPPIFTLHSTNYKFPNVNSIFIKLLQVYYTGIKFRGAFNFADFVGDFLPRKLIPQK